MIGTPDRPFVGVRPPGWVQPGADPLHDLIAWVERAESLDVDGVFVGDRLLSAAVVEGATVYDASMLDVTVTLSTIAARTRRLRLGPLVMVVPYRHPVQLAKTMASLDAASGGRLILGVGLGWNAKEFETLGISLAGRAARFEEAVDIMRRLWAGEVVDHAGPTWTLDQVQISPLPPHGPPPLWMASFSPGQALDWDDVPQRSLTQLERVGRLADGWVPLVYSASGKRRLDARVLGRAADLVQDAARRHDRERVDVIFSDWCFALDGPESRRRCETALSRFFHGDWDDACATYNIGTQDEVVERIREHTAHLDRVDGYVLTPLSDDIEQLDAMAGVADLLRA